MENKQCPACGQQFLPRPQCRHQSYCSAPGCRRQQIVRRNRQPGSNHATANIDTDCRRDNSLMGGNHQVVVNLIASTTNRKGLKVYCELDNGEYPKGIKVSDAQMEALKLDRHAFHGEWNYTISP